MSVARLAVQEWEIDSGKVLKQLGKQIAKANALNQKLRLLSESIQDDLTTANQMIEQHAHAMDSLRGEYDVLKEITLPILTSESRTYRERWDAEVATARMRRVHSNPQSQQDAFE
jgi:hypothetical protein